MSYMKQLPSEMYAKCDRFQLWIELRQLVKKDLPTPSTAKLW